MGIFDKILRTGEGKKLRALQGLVPDINALEPDLEKLSDDELRAKTPEFKQEIDNGAARTGAVDQAAELGRLTGMGSVFGPFMDYQGGQYGMALLSDLPFVNPTNFAAMMTMRKIDVAAIEAAVRG